MKQYHKTAKTKAALCLLFASSLAFSKPPTLDEQPAKAGEWGFRPADGAVSKTNPPAFSWRPQRGVDWELLVSDAAEKSRTIYRRSGIQINVHCPPESFPPGRYTWRYRGKNKDGAFTQWSAQRTFTIGEDAVNMPLPPREELLSRIPEAHPRLFLRPEKLPQLRSLARGKLKKQYDDLLRQSERILRNPPPTEEPPKYPKGTVRGSDPWRTIWWGNRRCVIAALDGAATLGFTWLLSGREEFGLKAKEMLLQCARWDPKGSTGYRYNDEAGMPYAYYFSRTYTFVNKLLTEEEKTICRTMMKVRGDEMYRHLHPNHFWRPYGSHRNRAWHFLGEVGIAFYNEIDAAGDWVWFAANVFFNTYPVWSDADGGWHEGSSYWSSYQNRFTWWADVMREALQIDAYQKPYYSKVGYYTMYLMPPGKRGGGFGDLTASKRSESFRSIMTTFAAQAQNSYWQWWVEENGGPQPQSGYIGFIRGVLPDVTAKAPVDLPASRLFGGTGQAYLNSTLFNAREGVQAAFKSSPFGTQSHGYEANNSFLISGYGRRLLIRSGRRDSYGSRHHQKWMWSTRSVNNILVNGCGQKRRTASAQGGITGFATSPAVDLVAGEAAEAYTYEDSSKKGSPLKRFTRTLLFIKPDCVVVFDRLEAKAPSLFTFYLHAVNKFSMPDQHGISIENGGVLCDIDLLRPAGLTLSQTDQYDPNPRPRIKLREWHLKAGTGKKQKDMTFISVYRIHKKGDTVDNNITIVEQANGYILKGRSSKGTFTALLPLDKRSELRAGTLSTRGKVNVTVQNGKGESTTVGLSHQR